jgi:hypothetical protein
MKKEFMLYIRNEGDAKAALSEEAHTAFINKCEIYVGRLKARGKLIAVQPIVREGLVLAKTGNRWTSIAVDPTKEVHVGYYHIIAVDIDEAVAIAKDNPEFEYVPSASIEVRPIKMKEEKTDFVYPE